jgi:hypothetical protein
LDALLFPLLLLQPPLAVFGGLFPLFPLLQSNESLGFTRATGAVGDGLHATTSDTSDSEAMRRFMIGPWVGVSSFALALHQCPPLRA